MKLNRLFLIPALALSGCASFQSGDVRVDRNGLREMLGDRDIVPFSAIKFTWTNYPYFNPAELIGQGTLEGTPPPKPVPVTREEFFGLRKKAEKILAEAGLYDRARGEGTLYLDITTYGRWTYRNIFGSFLVETPWIMIFPRSLRANYRLVATSDRYKHVLADELATHKTVFHALIFPLYPFARPGARENALHRNLLWKTATDIYASLKNPPPPEADGPPEEETGTPVPRATEEIEHSPVVYPGAGSTQKLPGTPLQ
ncbi:MAG: hypothetical protein FD189_1139 [Elusimicrobia bacterium]|nr:MAG: hypothetical protein FD154_846 [Elusimicrobiota bacterium]KAF0156095.1 MAG: hypothetical protein FD189_1139 [Elusimicrobiota bacterium]